MFGMSATAQYQLTQSIERKLQGNQETLKTLSSNGDAEATYILGYRMKLQPYRDTLNQMAKNKQPDAMFFKWLSYQYGNAYRRKKPLLKKTAKSGNKWACYIMGEITPYKKKKAKKQWYMKAAEDSCADACVALLKYYFPENQKDSIYIMINKTLEFCKDDNELKHFEYELGKELYHCLPKDEKEREKYTYIMPDITQFLTNSFNNGNSNAAGELMKCNYENQDYEQSIYYTFQYLEAFSNHIQVKRECYLNLSRCYLKTGKPQLAESYGLARYELNLNEFNNGHLHYGYQASTSAKWMSELYTELEREEGARLWFERAKEIEKQAKKLEKLAKEKERQARLERIANALDNVNTVLSAANDLATQINNYKAPSSASTTSDYSGSSSSTSKSSPGRKHDPYAASHEANKQNAENIYRRYSNQLIDMNTNYERDYNDSQRRQIQASMKKIRTEWEQKGYTFWHSPWENWDGHKQ